MGANTSDLSLDDIEEMQSISNLSQKEIKKLYKRFKRLDKESVGRITKEEILSIPELQMNPLAGRIVKLFDTNKDDQISFRQFVQVINAFSVKASPEEKQRLMFRIYDVKDDGVIDRDELKEVIKLMVGNNLSEEQMHSIVKRTLLENDKDGDGKISFDDFKESTAASTTMSMSVRLSGTK